MTDGSMASDAYPCTCGIETCETNERCHESMNFCQAHPVHRIKFACALVDMADHVTTEIRPWELQRSLREHGTLGMRGFRF